MKKYWSFFVVRMKSGLQYRAAAWAGIATQFAWGGMSLLLYRAFYESNSQALPMDYEVLSSYIWLQQALLALFMAWYFDGDILDAVSSGSVAYELCRPMDLYSMWFIKNMAVRVSRVLLRCAPILTVAVFLSEPYGLLAPVSLLAGFAFGVSLVLGFLVLVSFSMLIYVATFYTVTPNGIRILAISAVEFLAGGIIPIPFFPEWLQPIINTLPFASMQNAPLLIYIGYRSGIEVLYTLLLQAVWLSLLVLIGRLLMRRALRKVVVQGG